MARRPLWLALLALAVAAPATAQADGRYVALGDSVAAMVGSYVSPFGTWLKTHGGVTDVRNVAEGGATSTSLLQGQIRRALALIRDPTDTRVVTIDIGGNDYLDHQCATGTWNRPSCPFAENLAVVLGALRAALDRDPGTERLLVMSYYNPAAGTGTGQERDIDAGLYGTDGMIDPRGFDQAFGMTDIIAWEACRFGGTLVDPWAAFEAGGGQALMLDSVHPNAAGHRILATLFADASKGRATPSCPQTAPFATTSPDAGDGLLQGFVEPRLAPAHWWFEYGATTAYGSATAAVQLPASAGIRGVFTTLPEASGAYHARLVAENAAGRFAGADQVVDATGAAATTGTVGSTPVVDLTPPAAILSAAPVQRLGTTLSVVLVAPEESLVTVTGSLRGHGLGRIVRRLAPGQPLRVRLALSSHVRDAARAALRAHRRVTASVAVTATDLAGNAEFLHRTIRVRL